MRNRARFILPCAALAAVLVAIGLRLAGVADGPAVLPPATQVLLPGEPAILERFEAKSRIASEVIAGRRSLLEAAAAYKALEDQGPPCPGWVVLDPPPGVSEDEFYCQMAIDWVRSEAPPDLADDLTCVLEAEMYDRLRDGTLRLPDP